MMRPLSRVLDELVQDTGSRDIRVWPSSRPPLSFVPLCLLAPFSLARTSRAMLMTYDL